MVFWTAVPVSIAFVAEVVFWASVGMLMYVYLGYPTLLALVAPFYRRPNKQPGYYPTISVLIAAYNEEAHIGQKLAETLALDYPFDKMEILVVSDGSADRTDEIVNSCQDPRVKLLRIDARKGKTNAQNEGVKQCRGEVIVFSDATAVYHPNALQYLACHYEDAQVGAVSGRYQYFDPKGESPTGLGSVAFWNYENLIKKLQSRISTLTGCSGCIYSVRKSIYTPLSAASCSDLVEPLHVVRNGYRVVFEDRALAYEETTKSAKEEFNMRVRVAAHGISGVLSVPDLLKFWKHGWIAFQLISHKVLRWLVPFSLILLFACNALLVQRLGFRLVFLLQLAFYLIGLVSMLLPMHRQWTPLSIPLYFCTLHVAALVSVISLMRGNRFVVWETVRK